MYRILLERDELCSVLSFPALFHDSFKGRRQNMQCSKVLLEEPRATLLENFLMKFSPRLEIRRPALSKSQDLSSQQSMSGTAGVFRTKLLMSIAGHCTLGSRAEPVSRFLRSQQHPKCSRPPILPALRLWFGAGSSAFMTSNKTPPTERKFYFFLF